MRIAKHMGAASAALLLGISASAMGAVLDGFQASGGYTIRTYDAGVSGVIEQGTGELGWGGATWGHVVPVFSFALPPLPAGEQVVSVRLDLQTRDFALGNYNADLQAINVVSGANDAQAAYFSQAATTVAADLFTSATPQWSWISTSQDQSDALGAWLDQNYVVGGSLNLRLMWDTQPTIESVYRVTASGGQAPWLTITTAPIPEPTMLGIAATGMLLLARRQPRA